MSGFSPGFPRIWTDFPRCPVDIISKHIQGLAKDALHYRESKVRDHFIAEYGLAQELCTSATPLQCAELFLAAEDLRKVRSSLRPDRRA